MVFNWFRREQNSRENPKVNPEQQAPPPVEPEKAESIEEPSPPAAEDYLIWAKAAYQTIQKQRQAAAADLAVVASMETAAPEDGADAVEDVEPTLVPEAPVLRDPTPEPPTELPTPDTPVVAPALDEVIAVGAEAGLLAVEEVEETEAPVTAVPIWARQSTTQRQARLERLKASALETEPEPVHSAVQEAAPGVAVTTEVQEITFDEGFLWSAEVLAAQGRRPEDVSVEEISWLKRLRQGLSKTRRSLVNQLKAIVGQGPLNQDAVTEIEALLLQADVGVEATDSIISTLQKRLREEVLPPTRRSPT